MSPIILFLIAINSLVFSIDASLGSSLSVENCNCTEYEQSFQNLVIRRKRRGIIFPIGSSILITHAITKVMTGATPRGLSVSYEMDMYFPLPDTVEGLYPKKTKPKYKSRKDFWNEKITEPVNYPDFHATKYETTLWKNYHFHRQRRDIYRKIESAGSIMGFAMKECIMRSICEAKKYLLPPGKSMMQDLIRILFTFASNEIHTNDEYYRASQVIEEDCHSIYKLTCPMSLIEILLRNGIS